MKRDYFRSAGKCARVLAVPLLMLFGLSMTSVAFADDTTPPSVTGLTLNPTSVDVTLASKSVLVTMTATDDLSGVAFVTVTFTSPHVNQQQFAFLFLSNGTSTNGVFSGNATIPQYADNGTWNITSVFIGDNAGNSVNIPNSTLLTIPGVATTLPVISNPDTQAPTVVGMPVFSPAPIDVSAGNQTLTMTFSITDDVSGVDFSKINGFDMTLQSPSGNQHQYIAHGDFNMISGTNTSGTWQVTHTMPQYSEAGTWSIASLQLSDAAGNLRTVSLFGSSQLPAQFTVVSSPQDIMAPTLTSFDFTPKFIDTSAGPQNVTVTLGATDDLSGVSFLPDNLQISTFHGFQFQSPSHGQNIFCCAFTPTFTLTGGTSTNGTWQATVTLPQFSEEGTWKASILQLKDQVENMVSLTTSQLGAIAPTDLIIIKPSATSDGTIGTSGGTVTDTASGAQLTLPSGAVTGNTTVAIDVLANLNLPIPAGYSGFGTKFVNIELNPLPSFPLAHPGATVVLPLQAQGTPGGRLDLFFVDPATGTLLPMPSTAGGNVQGAINGNGLGATFGNASHASTLVGLVPATGGTDTTPPVISPNISGTIGNNGWYVSSTSVGWTVTDAESGIASSTGCSLTTLSADTNGTKLTCSATNGAGLTASQDVTIKIDRTNPTVSYSGNQGTYSVDATVNITCTASDAGSGIASSTCHNISGAAYSFNPGNNNFSGTATDKAGNQGSGSGSFKVQDTFSGLIGLVNQFETKSGVAATMISALQSAQAASNSGNVKIMDNQLKAFINQVQAQNGKSVSSSQAAILVKLAQALE